MANSYVHNPEYIEAKNAIETQSKSFWKLDSEDELLEILYGEGSYSFKEKKAAAERLRTSLYGEVWRFRNYKGGDLRDLIDYYNVRNWLLPVFVNNPNLGLRATRLFLVRPQTTKAAKDEFVRLLILNSRLFEPSILKGVFEASYWTEGSMFSIEPVIAALRERYQLPEDIPSSWVIKMFTNTKVHI